MNLDSLSNTIGVPVDPSVLDGIRVATEHVSFGGVQPLKRAETANPIAWVDPLGNILPWPQNAELRSGVDYIYTQEELDQVTAQVLAAQPPTNPSAQLDAPAQVATSLGKAELTKAIKVAAAERASMLKVFNTPA